MDAHPAGSLLSFLAAVPEPRSRHGRRHPLCVILQPKCERGKKPAAELPIPTILVVDDDAGTCLKTVDLVRL